MLAQDPASIYCKLSPLLDEEWPRKDPYPGQILGYENRDFPLQNSFPLRGPGTGAGKDRTKE